LDAFGAGAKASPLICGFTAIHAQLARELAEFKGAERALTFPSGITQRAATLGALADAETTILLDRLSHAEFD